MKNGVKHPNNSISTNIKILKRGGIKTLKYIRRKIHTEACYLVTM